MNTNKTELPRPSSFSGNPLALPDDLLLSLLALAQETSEQLLQHYNSAATMAVDRKVDKSPVTAADRDAHDLILGGLRAITPEIPVLSEESSAGDIADRRAWPVCWIVDPLDGTKEFLGGTDEFTINIALVDGHRPILGLIAVPVENCVWLGLPGVGAWRCPGFLWEQREPLTPMEDRDVDIVRLVASARHHPERVAKLLESLRPVAPGIERINAGSAVKFCALVDGRAEIYPRTSPCCEWDVAAGDALIHAVGGYLVGRDGEPLKYNDRAELLVNYFVAGMPQHSAWAQLIEPV